MAFMSDDQLDNEFRISIGETTTSIPDIRATAEQRAVVSAWRDANVRTLSKVLYGWIMNNVNWQHDPELARLIRTGDDTCPAFSESKDGRLLFLYLQKRGSRAQPHVQSEMQTEWATVFSEAHTKHPTKAVFSDTTTCDSVIKQLNTLLEIYESISANRNAPADVFVHTMLKLLSREVPCLQHWAEAELNRCTLNPEVYKSRSDWVTNQVALLLRHS